MDFNATSEMYLKLQEKRKVYDYTVEFKDKAYRTIDVLHLGSNFGCLAAVTKKLKSMNLNKYTNNPKIVKIWIMMNGDRQVTLNINEFKR